MTLFNFFAEIKILPASKGCVCTVVEASGLPIIILCFAKADMTSSLFIGFI